MSARHIGRPNRCTSAASSSYAEDATSASSPCRVGCPFGPASRCVPPRRCATSAAGPYGGATTGWPGPKGGGGGRGEKGAGMILLQGAHERVDLLRFSPDGRLLVAPCEHEVQVWNG